MNMVVTVDTIFLVKGLFFDFLFNIMLIIGIIANWYCGMLVVTYNLAYHNTNLPAYHDTNPSPTLDIYHYLAPKLRNLYRPPSHLNCNPHS